MPRSNIPATTSRAWLMRGVSAAGVILLAAVPALGLTVLSPGMLATAAKAIKNLSGTTDDAGDPLDFGAPTKKLQIQELADRTSRPQISGTRGPLPTLGTVTVNQSQGTKGGATNPTTITSGRGAEGQLPALQTTALGSSQQGVPKVVVSPPAPVNGSPSGSPLIGQPTKSGVNTPTTSITPKANTPKASTPVASSFRSFAAPVAGEGGPGATPLNVQPLNADQSLRTPRLERPVPSP